MTDSALKDCITLYTDGGSRGNPGPGAGAFVISNQKGEILEARGIYLGNTTNNVAEYTAMLEGLKAANTAGFKKLKVFSDSELMVRQINGQYKVKNQNLKTYYTNCMQILSGFASWQVNHVKRDKNKQADMLANRTMDAGQDVVMQPMTKPAEKNTSTQEPIRLAVLISGGGRTMANIQKEIDEGSINAKIAIVISSRSKVRGVELTKKLGLELEIVRRRDFDNIESFSDKIAQILNSRKVDLVIQAGWLCLWKIPEKYQNKVMNIHPALLPSFGGKGMWGHHVHQAVLETGCKVSGCTVHFCTNEYDKGPILVQRCCKVKESDDPDSLAARVFKEECKAYPKAINLFAQKRIKVENNIAKIAPLK